tara:strand:+ start:250 stop:450 length:201 start_codon:yes stop_codon:yes gene_type:complete
MNIIVNGDRRGTYDHSTLAVLAEQPGLAGGQLSTPANSELMLRIEHWQFAIGAGDSVDTGHACGRG